MSNSIIKPTRSKFPDTTDFDGVLGWSWELNDESETDRFGTGRILDSLISVCGIFDGATVELYRSVDGEVWDLVSETVSDDILSLSWSPWFKAAVVGGSEKTNIKLSFAGRSK